MKRLLFVYFMCFIYLTCDSQTRRDAVWCFGDSVNIDFNQNPPLLDYSATRSRGTACSIADSNGTLQFYGHTFNIIPWQAGSPFLGVIKNKQHQQMEMVIH